MVDQFKTLTCLKNTIINLFISINNKKEFLFNIICFKNSELLQFQLKCLVINNSNKSILKYKKDIRTIVNFSFTKSYCK